MLLSGNYCLRFHKDLRMTKVRQFPWSLELWYPGITCKICFGCLHSMTTSTSRQYQHKHHHTYRNNANSKNELSTKHHTCCKFSPEKKRILMAFSPVQCINNHYKYTLHIDKYNGLSSLQLYVTSVILNPRNMNGKCD